MFRVEKYLRVPSEDINERQESTNQETIDINKLWLAGGLARHRFGCKSMREMAGPKSAIIHISTYPIAIISTPFCYNVERVIHCVSNTIVLRIIREPNHALQLEQSARNKFDLLQIVARNARKRVQLHRNNLFAPSIARLYDLVEKSSVFNTTIILRDKGLR